MDKLLSTDYSYLTNSTSSMFQRLYIQNSREFLVLNMMSCFSIHIKNHVSAVRCGGSSSRIRIRKDDKHDMSSRMRKKRHKTKCIDTNLEIVSLSPKSKT